MKNLTKTLFALLAVAFSISFTSCLGSDDNSDTSQIQPGTQEYANFLAMMNGSYSGKMLFYNDTLTATANNPYKRDTIEVMANVIGRDTTIYTSIPANCLLKSLKGYDELQKSMSSMPVSLKMKFALPYKQNNAVFFGVYPLTATATAEYGNADEKHEVKFDFGTLYSSMYKDKYLEFLFSLYKITLDGKAIETYSLEQMTYNTYYYFIMDKQW